MSTITIELDNLTAEEQETVRRLAEKKKEPYFVPVKGEKYFLIDGCGFIDVAHNDEMDGDGFTISIGNCFRTEEEAKEAKIRLQMQTKWRRLSLEAGEADNPWDGDRRHWFAYWHCRSKEIRYDFSDIWKQEKTYFPSEESLEAAISEFGEENVKKYIFGVNDGR